MQKMNYENGKNQGNQESFYKKIITNRKGQIGIAVCVVLVLVGIIVGVVYATSSSKKSEKAALNTIPPGDRQEVYAGVDSFEITCEVSHYKEKKKLQWTDAGNNAILEKSENPTTLAGRDKLILKFVKPTVNHSGDYTCSYSDANQIKVTITFVDNDIVPRFAQNYETVTSIEGTELLTVPCFANGSEPMEYRWYRPEGFMVGTTSPDDEYPYLSESLMDLNIPNVKRERNGLYICKVRNKYGSAEKTFEILSFKDVVPRITGSSQNRTFYENNELTFSCSTQGPGPMILEYYNQRNETIVNDTSSGIYVLSNGAISIVIIESANITHEGEYGCVVKNDYGSASKNFYVSFRKGGTPKFSINYSKNSAYLNDKLSLICDAGGAKPMTYDWYNQQNELIANGSTLAIKSVGTSDKGQYRCLAKNKYGAANKTFTVSIIKDGTPNFHTGSEDKTATENAEMALVCIPGGSKPMTFAWMNQKNKSLENSTSYDISTDRFSTLTIKSVQSSDLGEYRCIAANSFGSATRRFNVSFYRKGRPQFLYTLTTVKVKKGSKFQLQCQAHGEWPIIYTWYNQSDQITSNDISTKPYGSYLTVEHAELRDFRIYTCVAKNKHGLGTMEYNVIVLQGLDSIQSENPGLDKLQSIGRPATNLEVNSPYT